MPNLVRTSTSSSTARAHPTPDPDRRYQPPLDQEQWRPVLAAIGCPAGAPIVDPYGCVLQWVDNARLPACLPEAPAGLPCTIRADAGGLGERTALRGYRVGDAVLLVALSTEPVADLSVVFCASQSGADAFAADIVSDWEQQGVAVISHHTLAPRTSELAAPVAGRGMTTPGTFTRADPTRATAGRTSAHSLSARTTSRGLGRPSPHERLRRRRASHRPCPSGRHLVTGRSA